jgi:hypothetical protein
MVDKNKETLGLTETKYKICPILTIAGVTCGEGIKCCEENKCAFWCDWKVGCAFLTIAEHLAELRR